MTHGTFDLVKMWTSGVIEDGSSSVPARTKRTSGRPYSLKTATRHVGQR